MSGYAVKTIDEMQGIHHGLVKLAGAELGTESFGLQLLDLPGGFSDYPEHDHSEDGQEEVYVVLSGTTDFEVGGARVAASPGTMVRVAPGVRRKLWPGPDGARVLAIGCARVGAYERPADFELAARS